MGWRRCLEFAGVLLLGAVVGGGVMYAVGAGRFSGAKAQLPPGSTKAAEPKPSPVATGFGFKGMLERSFQPIRNDKYVINQNQNRRDEIGLSQTTCLGICICKGGGHEGFMFEKLPDAVRAEIESKGGKVDFRLGGVAFDMAKSWTGEFSSQRDGESYSGTARIWCVAEPEVANLGQRFTVIITLDERGPDPVATGAQSDGTGR